MSSEYKIIMNEMAVAVAKASQKIREDFLSQARAESLSEKAAKASLPDFVTSTDTEAQDIIQNYLGSKFPEIYFVGEESQGNGIDLNRDVFFLVDPLDGTSNFVALRDYFASCAAYVVKGEVKAAVIADPMRGQLVKAYVGSGCIRASIDEPISSEKPIQLMNDAPLNQYQLECELAMSSAGDFEIMSRLLPMVSGMRKSGSTALDVMNIALGRRSILISDGLLPHDIAAPILIAREAGAAVFDAMGQAVGVDGKSLIVTPPAYINNILFALEL